MTSRDFATFSQSQKSGPTINPNNTETIAILNNRMDLTAEEDTQEPSFTLVNKLVELQRLDDENDKLYERTMNKIKLLNECLCLNKEMREVQIKRKEKISLKRKKFMSLLAKQQLKRKILNKQKNEQEIHILDTLQE